MIPPPYLLNKMQLVQASPSILSTVTLALRALLPPSPSNSAASERVLFLCQQNLLLLITSCCVFLALLAYVATRPRRILLLDYACYKPDHDRKLSYEACQYVVRRSGRFSAESEEFMRGIYLKSGLGDETYAPPFLFQPDHDAPKLSSAFKEAEEGMFAAVDSLLAKARVDPSRVDVLVVACGMFAPSPSLSSLLVHHYGFPPSIKTYNLSGMGCSLGAVSTDMAARILSGSREIRYALVVTAENMSLNWYLGQDRSMLVSNCIFRVGCATALLTNDPARLGDAKMELLRGVTTHHGADDAAYGVVMQEEDGDGVLGVTLGKRLVHVAGARLRDHLRLLAPRVLPLSQLIRYASSILGRAAAEKWAGKGVSDCPRPTVVPDFTTAFEHMCVHAGGRAVVEAVERVMGLPEEVMEPARMTLHRFGNTSGPLVFYELAYVEAKGRVRKGDRVWMLSFGAGFMVCSLVWRALRSSGPEEMADNPWNECVHLYPVYGTGCASQ